MCIRDRYVSDATELGTVYTKAELTALRAACDAHGMHLYLDGARLAQALTAAGSDLQPEDLPRIFEKGYTGCNGRADKRSTGIGLYLCRQIMEKLSHTIRIESEMGVGTKVYLGLDTVSL